MQNDSSLDSVFVSNCTLTSTNTNVGQFMFANFECVDVAFEDIAWNAPDGTVATPTTLLDANFNVPGIINPQILLRGITVNGQPAYLLRTGASPTVDYQ